MQIVAFLLDGQRRLGFVADKNVIDPLAALGANDPARHHFADAIAFIKGGDDARRAALQLLSDAPAKARRPLESVKLAAPLLPSTILCSGSNYLDHNQEKANTPISGKEPEFFIKTADCVVGPGEPIVLDEKVTRKMDCETELAIVIGKPGRHIPIASALDHVFGYTIVNDVTARDRQVRRNAEGMVWYELGRGKCFDSSAPLGPVVVTADEVGDPQKLALKTRVNGELRQSSTTAQMIWSCAELVHFFSVNFTLRPGMVIITGTPAGTSWSMDKELGGSGKSPPGVVPAKGYCRPGDVVECEVERIGILKNTVIAG
jgi:2-keto-4-pentenoate hydratase/2-oxohepta-3-ene-1,7-dioic acid hydratase in catechol pathway